MTLMTMTPSRRKTLAKAIAAVLSPAQLTMAHELIAAERPGQPAPQAEEVLFWMRLNMPTAAARVDELV